MVVLPTGDSSKSFIAYMIAFSSASKALASRDIIMDAQKPSVRPFRDWSHWTFLEVDMECMANMEMSEYTAYSVV